MAGIDTKHAWRWEWNQSLKSSPETDLEAAEKVHASGLRRQVSADQRCAVSYLLMELCRRTRKSMHS